MCKLYGLQGVIITVNYTTKLYCVAKDLAFPDGAVDIDVRYRTDHDMCSSARQHTAVILKLQTAYEVKYIIN